MAKKKEAYIFYASEDCDFEVDKYKSTDVYRDVKDLLEDDYFDVNQIETFAYSLQCEFREKGIAFEELENGQGLTVFIGVACPEKCSEISEKIAELYGNSEEEEDED